jgi:N-acetylneuraminic acid mutarotase
LQSGTWTTATALPMGLGGLASGSIAGQLIVSGAIVSPTYTYSTQPDAGWATLAPMPENDSQPASAVLFGKLYSAGGAIQSDTNNNSHALWVFDPAQNSWDVTRASMPTARNRAAAAFIGAKLFVAGAMASCAPCSPLAIFDANSNTWSTVAPLPTARSSAMPGVLNGAIHLVGGRAADYDTLYPVHEVFAP